MTSEEHKYKNQTGPGNRVPTTPLMGSEMEPLWSIEEVATYLGFCDDTVRPMVQHLAIRFGKRAVRYVPSDVRELVLSLRGEPAAEGLQGVRQVAHRVEKVVRRPAVAR